MLRRRDFIAGAPALLEGGDAAPKRVVADADEQRPDSLACNGAR